MPITVQEFNQPFVRLGIPEFASKLPDPALGWTNEQLATMQVNVGYACNFACGHCFLESSPQRTEIMSRQVMSDCLQVFAENGFTTLDITGGAPELNPELAWLVSEGAKLGAVMVRSNAALLVEPEYAHLVDTFKENKVTAIVSLPCYTEENVDSQRGAGNYQRILAGLRVLNAAGYGSDPELELNLVYNPMGAYLPGAQGALEQDYRDLLGKKQGLVFNSLFCLANTPLGRFRSRLLAADELDDYLTLLAESFNPDTVAAMMCRSQLNVDYDGRLYDCEMNHVLGLEAGGDFGNISELKGHPLAARAIRLNGGCYTCTAGSGSSCGGSLVCEA
ncbi:MAG: arsenosugar biosynthesis radical SAM protein ArsS [Coriobacteriales bacterium]|jgi:radical SAM/Cys-rich protein|nr:arsenosugar biosynthesis radical SAM protein ArsS [Coriobacteriales bacterium]